MWGKFGQRLNKTQIQAFHDPQAFHQFLDKDSLDVRHVAVINHDMVEVHYQNQKEDIRVSPNLNIFVACFTTCHARLKLYAALEALGERVLYFDTDSVIYLEETPTQFQPTLGSYLGDFTSELDDDEYIEEFVSGGPKNYGYATNKKKVECKVRGFRLNSEGHTQLNYDVMRQNVQDEIQNPLPKPREIQVTKTPITLFATQPTTPCSLNPNTNGIAWCMTNESSIPAPSRPTPMDTSERSTNQKPPHLKGLTLIK